MSDDYINTSAVLHSRKPNYAITPFGIFACSILRRSALGHSFSAPDRVAISVLVMFFSSGGTVVVKNSFYLVLAFACSAGTSIADQTGLDRSFATEHQNSSTTRSTQNRSQSNYQPVSYYLVSDSDKYSGDSVRFERRQYQLSRDGQETEGRHFWFGDLLLLWNSQERSYHLLNIESVDSGVWKSCWGQNPDSVRSCSEDTELVYIFEDENTAIEFGNSGDELAMGPDPEPTQPEPTQPEPTEPEPTEPEPTEPEPTEPEPTEPEPTEPEPTEPEPTEPEPTEPEPTEPEPTEPEPTEPEPTEPEPTEPEPTEPEPTEPEPTEPEPTEPEPTQPGNVAEVKCSAPSEELKAAILKATNDSRSQARQCGSESFSAASPLAWNNSLAAAASKHSRDMSSSNFFSHTGSDGLQVWDRAEAEGYQYGYIGENIAAGQDTVGVVQAGWIDSPGHCSNIMNPQITEMGAACVVESGSDYQKYWTVVVGQPR